MSALRTYVLLCLTSAGLACPVGHASLASGPCTPCPAGFFKATSARDAPCTPCPGNSTTLAGSARGAMHQRECVACGVNHVFRGLNATTGVAECEPCGPCMLLEDAAHQFRTCARAPLGSRDTTPEHNGMRCAREWGFTKIDEALEALSRNETWEPSYRDIDTLHDWIFMETYEDEQNFLLEHLLTQERSSLRDAEPLDATEQDVYDARASENGILVRRASEATKACRVSTHWHTMQKNNNQRLTNSPCFEDGHWKQIRTQREHGYCSANATTLSLFAYALPVHLPGSAFDFSATVYYDDNEEIIWPDMCTMVRGPGDMSTNLLRVPVQKDTTFQALQHYDLRRMAYAMYYDTLDARVEGLCADSQPRCQSLLETLLDTEYLTSADVVSPESGVTLQNVYMKGHDALNEVCDSCGRRQQLDADNSDASYNAEDAVSFNDVKEIATNICTSEPNNTLVRVMMQEVACGNKTDTVAGRFAALAHTLDANIATHTLPDSVAAARLDLSDARDACRGHGNGSLRVSVTSHGQALLSNQPWNGTALLLADVPLAPAVATVRVTSADGLCTYEAEFSVPAGHALGVPGTVGCPADETLWLQHADEFDPVYTGYLALEAAGRTVDTRFVSV